MTVFDDQLNQPIAVPPAPTRPLAVIDAHRCAKRVMDILVTFLLVVLVAPVVPLVMALIKLEDGGPVFFRQTRVGHQGELFTMLKFRSMVVGAERMLDDIRHMNEFDGPLFKVRHDPRVTRVGRFLRRYSLDELPQLRHVLSGKMSLVGPRPALPAEVEMFGPEVERRVRVKPGITGPSQVYGRSDLKWEHAVELDLHYVDNWSLSQDFVILLRTVTVVLNSKGAY